MLDVPSVTLGHLLLLESLVCLLQYCLELGPISDTAVSWDLAVYEIPVMFPEARARVTVLGHWWPGPEGWGPWL